ncbi:MAG: MBL fold metallo-hydrolase [Mycoplasma sp.]
MENNSFLIEQDESWIIIDPSYNWKEIKALINNLKKVIIVLTHSHFDHSGIYFNDVCETADIIFASSRLKEILDSSYDRRLFFDIQITDLIKSKITYVTDKQREFDMQFIFTPGHSMDSITIIYENLIFSGDFIFSNSIGRTDFQFSDINDMKNSIKNFKNLICQKEYIICPGHGELISSIDILKTNPYLR